MPRQARLDAPGARGRNKPEIGEIVGMCGAAVAKAAYREKYGRK